MKEVWLKCDVSKGMFPGESGASFMAENGESISLFCPEKYVDKNDGRLKVRIVDDSSPVIVIRLPSESLNGTKIVRVPRDQVNELQSA